MTKPLHESDFFAWTQAQADALRRRSSNELDWEKLEEEVEGLGNAQRGELYSHFVILLLHLLKWHVQPARRGRSWRLSIAEQRREIERLVRINPSLKPIMEDIFQDAYPVARLRALRETRLADGAIPEIPALALDQAMSGALED